MPAIPDTDITTVEVAMKGTSVSDTGEAKTIINVYHFRRTNTTFALSKSQINTAFQAGIGAAVLAALNERYTQSENIIRWVDDALDPPQSFTQTGTGAITGESHPDFVTASLQLKTGLRGRHYRGAKRYAPISEADTKGDVLDASGITLITAIGTAILAGFVDANGNNWEPVILSTTLSQLQTNPTTVVANDITSTRLNKSLGIMKRRKIKTVN